MVKEEGRGRPGEENVVKSIGDVLEVGYNGVRQNFK